jgi:hypothetical protein
MCTVNFFEPGRLWRVDRFEGNITPRRCFGTDLCKAEALKRASLVKRLFPERAAPAVTPSMG